MISTLDKFGGRFDRRDHRLALRLALPGQVKGGAMRDAGANDGEAQRNVDCLMHGQQLQGNVALVVVHGHHRVEFAGGGT